MAHLFYWVPSRGPKQTPDITLFFLPETCVAANFSIERFCMCTSARMCMFAPRLLVKLCRVHAPYEHEPSAWTHNNRVCV